MQTEQQPKIASLVFLQTVSAAVTQLKQKLQQDYERVYPGLSEIIHLILDEEEAKAWELSLFPHLFLPDLVEAHVAKLGLEPEVTKQEEDRVPRRADEPAEIAAEEGQQEQGPGQRAGRNLNGIPDQMSSKGGRVPIQDRTAALNGRIPAPDERHCRPAHGACVRDHPAKQHCQADECSYKMGLAQQTAPLRR